MLVGLLGSLSCRLLCLIAVICQWKGKAPGSRLSFVCNWRKVCWPITIKYLEIVAKEDIILARISVHFGSPCIGHSDMN